jgi:hypothetical protein
MNDDIEQKQTGKLPSGEPCIYTAPTPAAVRKQQQERDHQKMYQLVEHVNEILRSSAVDEIKLKLITQAIDSYIAFKNVPRCPYCEVYLDEPIDRQHCWSCGYGLIPWEQVKALDYKLKLRIAYAILWSLDEHPFADKCYKSEIERAREYKREAFANLDLAWMCLGHTGEWVKNPLEKNELFRMPPQDEIGREEGESA